MAPRQRLLSAPSSSSSSSTTSQPSSSSVVEDSLSSSSESSENQNLVTKKTLTTSTTSTSHHDDCCVRTEEDIARDRHDYFNLVALLVILGSIVSNYDMSGLLSLDVKGSYIGNHFWLQWAISEMYFLTDLLWVWRVPICVKSPGVIIKHHMVAMIYLVAPTVWSEHRWIMGIILSVEINTWFLILRRVVYKTHSYKHKKRNNNSNKNNKHEHHQPVLSPWIELPIAALFYITWILIRCILYPFVMVVFLGMAMEMVQEHGTYFQSIFVCIPVHATLCLLNLKWTYDLFTPFFKQKSIQVQDGL